MFRAFLYSGAALMLLACGDDSTTGGGGTGANGGAGGDMMSTGGSGGDAEGGDAEGGDAEGGSGGAPIANHSVTFEARVNSTAFDCSQVYSNLGSTGATASLLDFRLYVHDVRLLSGDVETPLKLDQDGIWQYQTVALLDFEDKTGTCSNGTVETNTTLRGKAKAGTYDGIRFKLGVPEALNHQNKDVAPSPLNLTALYWDWLGGYKFARIDAAPNNSPAPFNMHLGSTACTGDPNEGTVTCERPNIAEITLTGFDPTKKTIIVDYGALVANSPLGADQGGAPGCMSGTADPECTSIFQNVGMDLATGALTPETQTLFSVQQ